MDRKIEKNYWSRKRILTISGIAGIFILLGAALKFTSGNSKLNVDAERITISEVTRNTFQEFIPVNGIVMPVTIIY
nr:efflux transporter periplasmic adaptor subunit [Flavisolibacter sp.]